MEHTSRRSAAIAPGRGNAIAGRIVYGAESALLTERGRTFVEIIAPGAFRRGLAEKSEVVATAGHMSADPLNCIGRWPGGGLSLTDSSSALDWSVDLPATQAARDLRALVEGGVINGASFEFVVEPGGERWEKRDGREVRTITAARLLEINPVASPAYSANTVEARRQSSPAADHFPITGAMAARLGLNL